MIQDDASSYLGKAFTLAVVLTNDVDHAESIVETAIDSLPAEIICEETLLAQVAASAWKRSQAAVQGLGQCQSIRQTSLPEELKRVFELPRQLRYCFSMRVLAGMSVHLCGRLIGLRPDQVTYLVDLSIQTLAKAARGKERRMSLAAR